MAQFPNSSEGLDPQLAHHAPFVVGMAVVGYSAAIGFAVLAAAKTLSLLYASHNPPLVLDWAVTVGVVILGVTFASPVIQTIRSLRQRD